MGTPYDWGGNSCTSGMDCSHFVNTAYNNGGLEYDYLTTLDLAGGEGPFLEVYKPQTGDIVLFNPEARHMGLYDANPPAAGQNLLHAGGRQFGSAVTYSSVNDVGATPRYFRYIKSVVSPPGAN